MVGAMDDDALGSMVQELGLRDHAWRMATNLTTADYIWGSPAFHKMGRFKVRLIRHFLSLLSGGGGGGAVVVSDIDTAWMRDPLPFFDRFPEADVLTSTDECQTTVADESLER